MCCTCMQYATWGHQDISPHGIIWSWGHYDILGPKKQTQILNYIKPSCAKPFKNSKHILFTKGIDTFWSKI